MSDNENSQNYVADLGVVAPAVAPAQPQLQFLQQNNLITQVNQPSLFPVAAELEAMKAIDPTWPERIMRQAELALEHNRKVVLEQQAQSRLVIESQNRANEINAKAQSDSINRQRLMDILGFIFLISVVGSCLWICLATKSDSMLKAFLGGLAVLVLYVWAKGQQSPK